jgi:hypothetical protein
MTRYKNLPRADNKQVCFFKKKHMRGLFAAVQDLFNLKISGKKDTIV